MRISKAHPRPQHPQRRGLSTSNFSGNGASVANGTANISAPIPSPNEPLVFNQDVNSNLPNSSPSTISNNSNSSNNNVTRPSSVSASPAKPVQTMVQPIVQPAYFPHYIYYPNTFPGHDYPGQIPQIYPPNPGYDGHSIYWPSWQHHPAHMDYVPRAAVPNSTGDAIHSPYGHGPTTWPMVSSFPTVVPTEGSEVPSDSMPANTFDAPRVQASSAPAHHHA